MHHEPISYQEYHVALLQEYMLHNSFIEHEELLKINDRENGK